jgi:hypothetical protein
LGDEGQNRTRMQKTAHLARAMVVSIETERRRARYAVPFSVPQSVEHTLPFAVYLMEIENLFRYTALAVGLKPSANQGKARLRGLYRIIYSKTIRYIPA